MCLILVILSRLGFMLQLLVQKLPGVTIQPLTPSITLFALQQTNKQLGPLAKWHMSGQNQTRLQNLTNKQ